jgi:ubiquinone/menaquinone biosynthesis C-methylase UbiE
VVTRALAARLGKAAEIVATDLNQPMLDLATRLQGDSGRVTFQQADALALPFEADTFDVIVCQFGVMFFPDKLLGYREARRMRKPGGTYLLSVWDELAANAFVTIVGEVLTRRFPDDPPRFMERMPHGYSDTQVIIAALEEAGFSEAVAETVVKLARADSAMSAATGYIRRHAPPSSKPSSQRHLAETYAGPGVTSFHRGTASSSVGLPP